MFTRTLLLLFITALAPALQAEPPVKSKTAAKNPKGRSAAQLLAAYMPKVKSALAPRWAAAVTGRMSEFSPGNVSVNFTLDAEGKVTAVAITANTSNELFAKFCDEFVRETKFEPPPADALAEGQVQIPFTFTIY